MNVSFHRVTAAWIADCREFAASPNSRAFASAHLYVAFGDGQTSNICLFGDKSFKAQNLIGQAGEGEAFSQIDLHDVTGIQMESKVAVDGSGFRWNEIRIATADGRVSEVTLFTAKVVTETVEIY